VGAPWKQLIKKGDLDGLRRWLDAGGALEADFDTMPLGYAANLGHLEIVKFLLARGEDPARSSAFLAAVIGGRYEVARLLLPLAVDADDLREAVGALQVYGDQDELLALVKKRMQELKKRKSH
jgi:hypothetical protein